MSRLSFEKDSKVISHILEKTCPKLWDGRRSILEMKKSGFPHWRQMEWIGFYFQFLCWKYLSGIMEIPGPKYNNVEFDAFRRIPWDFKTHVVK